MRIWNVLLASGALVTVTIACGRSGLDVDETGTGGVAGAGTTPDASVAVGGTGGTGTHGAGSSGGTGGMTDGGAGADAGPTHGCNTLAIDEVVDIPQPSVGDLTLRLVFSRPDESRVTLVRNRSTPVGASIECKKGLPGAKCHLGHWYVSALELDPLGSWGALEEPPFLTGTGRGLAVGTAATQGIALLHPTRKYHNDPAEIAFASAVDVSTPFPSSVVIDMVDGFGLFVVQNAGSNFLGYTYSPEPYGATRLARYGWFQNGIFSPSSGWGCGTSMLSGAAVATKQGFLFALSSSSTCQTPGVATRVQVIWTSDPTTYTPTLDLETGEELLAVRMVPRSSGAWVLWVNSVSAGPRPLMGLRVDAEGQPESSPQVIIPSFALEDSMSYARFGERLVVAHRSSGKEVALHVIEEEGGGFVQEFLAHTGTLGGQMSLLGAESGEWVMLAEDWSTPGEKEWDPWVEGSTVTRFVCSRER